MTKSRRYALGLALLSVSTAGCVCRPPYNPSVCVDFDPPLVVGTEYGASAGNSSGDVVFTSNNIPVSVHDFVYTGGGGNFNKAYIDNAPLPFGSGQSIRTNNINLKFDFSHLAFTPSQVQFEFLDMGGFENLSVNGTPVYAGEFTLAPSPMGGAVVSTFTTPVTGGKKGVMILNGPINEVLIGGQELWIDNVCVRQ